ncbi:MAG: hypothetical protein A2Z88_00480 [Omnitrophica WOR_2 bacterium GWA2_47_8]|nr:MAG: hypothetical protein A2Z88_00480 [Omnitrophica WOR_2 bacterium GWA2_47_8]
MDIQIEQKNNQQPRSKLRGIMKTAVFRMPETAFLCMLVFSLGMDNAASSGVWTQLKQSLLPKEKMKSYHQKKTTNINRA